VPNAFFMADDLCHGIAIQELGQTARMVEMDVAEEDIIDPIQMEIGEIFYEIPHRRRGPYIHNDVRVPAAYPGTDEALQT